MDTRYALRSMSRQPALAAIAIGLLALLVGLNTAILSLVDGVLLKPLTVRSADELAKINGAQEDFSELIFDQLRLQTSSISSRSFAVTDIKSRPTQTQPVNVPLVSHAYFRGSRARAINGHKLTSEDDQAEEAGIAELSYECPFSRDKVMLSKWVALKQKLLVIVSLTPGEIFGEAVESPDKVQKRSVRTTDCSADGTPDPCVRPHEDRSTTHAAVRNQNCVSLIGKKVEVDDEDQGPDKDQTPAPPPERAQER